MFRIAALALLLTLPASAGWRWDQVEGFVPDDSVRAPDKPATADELAAAGRFAAAGERYLRVAEAAAAEPAVRALALLKAADAYLLAKEWLVAFDAYEAFVLLAETHPQRLRARRFQIEACIMGVRYGPSFDFFGLTRAAPWAIKKARDLLLAHAYEDFSADARLRLADALLESEHPEEAAEEYRWLLEDYPEPPIGPLARFRKAESHLAQFEGVTYDGKPLADAKREFRKFLDDYPEDNRAKSAAARIGNIEELQAERDWLVAEHYRGRGKWRAALLYYREIVSRYPNSSRAEDARAEIPGAEEGVRRLPRQDREK